MGHQSPPGVSVDGDKVILSFPIAEIYANLLRGRVAAVSI